MIIAVDSSVVIAALLAWHERHEDARPALSDALPSIAVPAPALIESYSVMTRLPSPHRLSPTSALTALRETFRETSIITLAESEIWPLLERAAATGVAGGRTYDAHIMACAVKAGAKKLLTLNPRDFEALGVDGVEIDAL